MILDFSQNNINLIFEVSDEKAIFLKDFSFGTPNCNTEKRLRFCPAVEVHLCGENANDHHGGKHTGTYGSTGLKYQSHQYFKTASGNKLELTLGNDRLSVTLHYIFFDGISAIRCYTEVENISSQSAGLEYVSSFTYTGLSFDNPTIHIPHNSTVRELNWQSCSFEEAGLNSCSSSSTKRIYASNTGSWSTKEFLPMAAITDQSSALMFQIEHNGSWHWEISDIDSMLYLKLSGPTEQENGWFLELSPGESFESVPVAITLGEDFNDALMQMTLYRRTLIPGNISNTELSVIYNDYLHGLGGNPTTEKELPLIDLAAEVGCEYYCMDAGWYADMNGTWWETVGQWQPDPGRFPHGIKEVFDYIRKKGMIPGIWIEPEVMGINCPILSKFDDSCFFMRHGKRVIDHGRYQLDFRSKKVRDFLTSIIDSFVNDYGIGYIKIDYNIESGLGTEICSHSFGDGLLQHNRAYLLWIDEIRAKYPELILENCSSGGMRMDYAQLAHHHLQSLTDQGDPHILAYISSLAPTAVLPEQSAVWVCPAVSETKNDIAFWLMGGIMQRIHLASNLKALSSENLALVKEGINCYKQIRDSLKCSVPFYPLGTPRYGNKFLCLALKNSERTLVSVWRMDSEDSRIDIPFEAVSSANILYPRLEGYNVRKNENSITVTFPEKFCGALLEIK